MTLQPDVQAMSWSRLPCCSKPVYISKWAQLDRLHIMQQAA